MTIEHVGDSYPESIDIETPGQPNGHRNIVDSGLGLEPVEEPHPLLRKRKRNILRSFLGYQRGSLSVADVTVHPRSERADGTCLEQSSHRNRCTQFHAEPRRHLSRHQRIAAECEEIVIDTDTIDTQHITENLSDNLLHRRGRSSKLPRREDRIRQTSPIELAVGSEWQRIQHHERVGHHVSRQISARELREIIGLHDGFVLWDHISDQTIAEPVVCTHLHHCLQY